MLQLRAECVEPLEQLVCQSVSTKIKDEIVTCIFDTNIQFEQLDKMQLLPRDLVCIVYEYFDDKIIVNCRSNNQYNNRIVLFDMNDGDNKIIYHYYLNYNMLATHKKNFNQKDDSIMIISSSLNYCNLSRFYYHYTQNDDLTFNTYGGKSTATIDNNKYTIILDDIVYVLLVRNHEILQRRITVMKQLIDIIKKLHRSAQ